MAVESTAADTEASDVFGFFEAVEAYTVGADAEDGFWSSSLVLACSRHSVSMHQPPFEDSLS